MLTGSVAKVFDYRLGKIKHDFDKDMQLRSAELEELMVLKEELENRKKEIRTLEEDLHTWKCKYYEMLEQFIILKNQLDKK